MHHDFHPYTFGYNGEHLKHYDQVLTAKEDYGAFQTLDYIFELTCLNKNKPNKKEDKDSNSLHSSNASNHSSPREADVIINIKCEDNTNKESSINSNNSNNNVPNIGNVLGNNKNKLTVDYSSSAVEYFLVTEKPYQQLSDHFGLSVELLYI